ncbi:hypothetical protein MCEMSEM18_00084 [Comamonadaceae bacterium]
MRGLYSEHGCCTHTGAIELELLGGPVLFVRLELDFAEDGAAQRVRQVLPVF